MGTIKEEAIAYEPKHTNNIADLPEVSIDLLMVDDEFETEVEGKIKTVKQKVIELSGEKYRVPDSVLKQLKVHLKERPDLQRFKVNSSGVGLKTSYTVIPLS